MAETILRTSKNSFEMKRRYKFINWMAEVLGCTELIDYDQYNEVVPTKPYTGPIPEGLLKHNDDLKDLISKYPHKTPFISKMHQIGFGMDKDSSPPFQHYEEPRYMPNGNYSACIDPYNNNGKKPSVVVTVTTVIDGKKVCQYQGRNLKQQEFDQMCADLYKYFAVDIKK